MHEAVVPRRQSRLRHLFARHTLSVALVAIILFQVTVFKYLLGALTVSRVVNLALFTGSLVVDVVVLFHDRHVPRVWRVYLLPALLTAAACSANLAISAATRSDVANQLGITLVMASVIAVTFFHKRGMVDKERLWRLYFNALVVIVALGLMEYLLIFAGGYPLRSIQTDGGVFLAGRLSILHATDGGVLHPRFYGAFPEPGTLAMWILPALAYGVMDKRVVGVAILLAGIAFTQSLGGLISLVILGGALLVSLVRRTRVAFLLIPVVSVGLIWGAIYLADHYFVEAYQARGRSATLRWDNLVGVAANFPGLVGRAPFGMQRAASTGELMRNPLFFGSTFAISNVFMQGGLLAVLGFVTLVVQSTLFAWYAIVRRTSDKIDLVCAVSIAALLPFLVQRSTLWESSLFAILFAPSLLGYLESRRPAGWIPPLTRTTRVQSPGPTAAAAPGAPT